MTHRNDLHIRSHSICAICIGRFGANENQTPEQLFFVVEKKVWKLWKIKNDLVIHCADSVVKMNGKVGVQIRYGP